MKGLWFDIVQEVAAAECGEECWDTMVQRADLDGAYTIFGTYPDFEFEQLVMAASEVAYLPRAEFLALAGRRGFPHLAARHPLALRGCEGWRDVLAQLGDVVHGDVVRQVYRDARLPDLEIVGAADGRAVTLAYRSDRQLCALAAGLLLGLGDWYGEPLRVEHVACALEGDARCLLEVGPA